MLSLSLFAMNLSRAFVVSPGSRVEVPPLQRTEAPWLVSVSSTVPVHQPQCGKRTMTSSPMATLGDAVPSSSPAGARVGWAASRRSGVTGAACGLVSSLWGWPTGAYRAYASGWFGALWVAPPPSSPPCAHSLSSESDSKRRSHPDPQGGASAVSRVVFFPPSSWFGIRGLSVSGVLIAPYTLRCGSGGVSLVWAASTSSSSCWSRSAPSSESESSSW